MADFTCQVTGEPVPEVQFFYNGKELKDEGRYMIFEEDDLHHLEVYEIVPEDEGRYVATATNLHGQAECTADLLVKRKYQIKYFVHI